MLSINYLKPLCVKPTLRNHLRKRSVKQKSSPLTSKSAKLSINYVKQTVQRGFDNYHAKFIQISSIDSLHHVCFSGMIFSRLFALLEERCHLEHQKHAKSTATDLDFGLLI